MNIPFNKNVLYDIIGKIRSHLQYHTYHANCKMNQYKQKQYNINSQSNNTQSEIVCSVLWIRPA